MRGILYVCPILVQFNNNWVREPQGVCIMPLLVALVAVPVRARTGTENKLERTPIFPWVGLNEHPGQNAIFVKNLSLFFDTTITLNRKENIAVRWQHYINYRKALTCPILWSFPCLDTFQLIMPSYIHAARFSSQKIVLKARGAILQEILPVIGMGLRRTAQTTQLQKMDCLSLTCHWLVKTVGG